MVLDKTLADDGSNVSSFLFGLKTSDDLGERKRFEKIQQEFRDMFKFEGIEFDVILKNQNIPSQRSVDQKPLTHTLQVPVTVVVNDSLEEQFPIADVGAGVRESIYLLALVLGSRDSVVLLDEPSINMHPSLTRKILGKISDIEENQILITTHSPAIASFAAFENPATILYVRKSDSSSVVKTLGDEAREMLEEKRKRLRYMVDPGIFFAKCVVLVEGESDKSLMIGIWRRLELDVKRDIYYDILVVPVGGKKNFEMYQKMLGDFGVPYLIFADKDAKELIGDSKDVGKKTVELEGFTSFVIENGKLEDLMRDIDSRACKKAHRKSNTASVNRFLEELDVSDEELGLFMALFDKAACLSKK